MPKRPRKEKKSKARKIRKKIVKVNFEIEEHEQTILTPKQNKR